MKIKIVIITIITAFFITIKYRVFFSYSQIRCSLFPVLCSILPTPYSLLPIPYSLNLWLI
ncbi:MAG: hypothetical protein F6J98_33405 [Moorea sp. SIO4G2]|uniref:hypothetical protein n=1 Tax=Moorena bouillonii TaxID=207920 RepID=UPI00117E6271|nr:hypothetical protein [Moorena bouillonii]NEO65030.1 hypothetical protein [Moorena sp. SIO4G2]